MRKDRIIKRRNGISNPSSHLICNSSLEIETVALGRFLQLPSWALCTGRLAISDNDISACEVKASYRQRAAHVIFSL